MWALFVFARVVEERACCGCVCLWVAGFRVCAWGVFVWVFVLLVLACLLGVVGGCGSVVLLGFACLCVRAFGVGLLACARLLCGVGGGRSGWGGTIVSRPIRCGVRCSAVVWGGWVWRVGCLRGVNVSARAGRWGVVWGGRWWSGWGWGGWYIVLASGVHLGEGIIGAAGLVVVVRSRAWWVWVGGGASSFGCAWWLRVLVGALLPLVARGGAGGGAFLLVVGLGWWWRSFLWVRVVVAGSGGGAPSFGCVKGGAGGGAFLLVVGLGWWWRSFLWWLRVLVVALLPLGALRVGVGALLPLVARGGAGGGGGASSFGCVKGGGGGWVVVWIIRVGVGVGWGLGWLGVCGGLLG